MKFLIDIESSGLLGDGLDYSSLPYKLKESYRIWCIVIRNISTGTIVSFRAQECTRANIEKALEGCTELIGHNIINFDLPVLKFYMGFDYLLGYPGQPSYLFGKECIFTDTLLWSKLLHADRYGGHSLAAWGKRMGNNKGDFNDWSKFSEEMLEYCIQDTSVNVDVYHALIKEQGKHDWSEPYFMELKLADLTLKQELFGFAFDKEKARKNIEELSAMMQTIQAKVNPLLPVKMMTKSELSTYTLPKVRFKKNGEMSSHMQKFLDKHQAVINADMTAFEYEGKTYVIAETEYLINSKPASVEDIDVVKKYLLDMGWTPADIKERDLCKKPDKSEKTREEIVSAIERYVNQTETSLFRDLRLEFLECEFDDLKDMLLGRIQGTKPIYVPTNPRLTIGQEKEICPNLVALGEKAEFVKDVVHYFTYRHRKNSIAGGIVLDGDEEDEPLTGFLSAVREDGRVPTPADTLGANTGRYRHRIICNIPRITSLYGAQMRGLFGCGKGLYQLGYDFSSLEARVMGHYVIPYKDGDALAEALVALKPNDIHSLNAKKLGIKRDSAKNFSYASIYGAQPKKLAKMLAVSEQEAKRLFTAYWEAVPALKELKDKLEKVWEKSGKKHILGLDGRILSTRSKHSLINVLFQSGGAIAAKWSAVYLAQELEEAGILGNPFEDTLQEHKVWWLIHMHDEQQLGVHPALMQVKNYSDDAAAEAARIEGCSSIGHGSKGTYMGFKTKPVECIEAGIARANAKLNLRVTLGYEWSTGLTWEACH